MKPYLLNLFFFAFVSCADESGHLEMTPEQSQTFQKFKEEMLPQITLDYLKLDIFLVRFLRARNFNLEEAKKMLKTSLKWREDNKMDKIHSEDWSDFQSTYPVYLDGVDKLGQPVFYANYGEDWSVLAAAKEKKLDRFLRWTIKAIDAAMVKVFRNDTLNKVATRFSFIDNFKGFALDKHVCTGSFSHFECLKFYSDFVRAYEDNYPEMCGTLILINVPPSYDLVLKVVRPLFSKKTNEMIKILGEDPKLWETAVFEKIERDQLPPEIGGTGPSHKKVGGEKPKFMTLPEDMFKRGK